MRKYVIFIFLIISQMMLAQNITEYRNLMKTGESSMQSTKKLIELSNSAYSKTNEPIYAGFLAVGQFFMAKHAFSPFKKMSYFNEGKKNLDGAIKQDPKNVEIRLMRLITQEKIPRFLGYNHNIEEDRNFLIKEYRTSTDSDLRLYVKNYLKL